MTGSPGVSSRPSEPRRVGSPSEVTKNVTMGIEARKNVGKRGKMWENTQNCAELLWKIPWCAMCYVQPSSTVHQLQKLPFQHAFKLGRFGSSHESFDSWGIAGWSLETWTVEPLQTKQVAGTIAVTDEGWPKGFRRSRAWSQYDSAGMRNEGVRKKNAVNFCKSLGDFECLFDKISKLLAPPCWNPNCLYSPGQQNKYKQLAWDVFYQFCFTIGSLAPWPPTPADLGTEGRHHGGWFQGAIDGGLLRKAQHWLRHGKSGKIHQLGPMFINFLGENMFFHVLLSLLVESFSFLEGTTRNQQRSSRKRIQLWKRDIYPLMTLIYRWFSH